MAGIQTGKTDLDKGSVEAENLAELYADLGLFLRYDKPAQDGIAELEGKNGDLTNEILYLMGEDAVSVDEGMVYLKSTERELAEKIADRIYNQRDIAEDLIDEQWMPDYLSEPGIEEEYNEPIEELEQEPSDEIPSRIFEVLSENKRLKPEQVERKLAVETTFSIEPWLKYLETQDVVERTENNRYSLNSENISDTSSGERLNVEGKIIEEQRYGNNPWKP